MIKPWRMCEGYDSQSLCVCVYLSVTTLANTYYLVFTLRIRCLRVLCGAFPDLECVAFAKNALFKSSGVIC